MHSRTRLFAMALALVAACFTSCAHNDAPEAKSPTEPAASSDPEAAPAQDPEQLKAQEELDKAAEERFNSLEPEYQKIMEQKLEGLDDKQLQEKLTEVSTQMQNLAPGYADIIQNGNSPKWAVASLVNLGSMYQHVGDELNALKAPEGVPEDVAQAYSDLVRNFAGNFTEQAGSFYDNAVKLADEHQVQSEYADRARQTRQPSGE